MTHLGKIGTLVAMGLLFLAVGCVSMFNEDNEFYQYSQSPACSCDTSCGCDFDADAGEPCACDADCNCAPFEREEVELGCNPDFECDCDQNDVCDVPCDCDPECRAPDSDYGSSAAAPCGWCACDDTNACDSRSCVCDPDCE